MVDNCSSVMQIMMLSILVDTQSNLCQHNQQLDVQTQPALANKNHPSTPFDAFILPYLTLWFLLDRKLYCERLSHSTCRTRSASFSTILPFSNFGRRGKFDFS